MPWLSLLFSPIGRWALVAAGVCLAFGGGYWKGYAAADRAADVRQLEESLQRARAEQAEAVRQSMAAIRIATESAQRQREAETQVAALQAEIDSYADEIKARPDGGCALGPSDVRRLRGLAGGADSAPGPPARPADLR